jgi:hypothetical protein
LIKDKDGYITNATIIFHKNHPTYLQSVIVNDTVKFGHDFTPLSDSETGQVWIDLYKNAYKKQFECFKRLVSGEDVQLDLLESYGRTFTLLETILCMV